MPSEVVLEALRRHPLASGLDAQQFEHLASLASIRHISKGEILFREGEQNEHFYLILDGPIALEMKVPRGMLQVQRLGAGDGLGWSSALVGRGKFFQARALDEAEALEFHGSEVLAFCRENPAFGYLFAMRLLEIVSNRLQATRLQLVDMHSPVAKQAGI